MTSIVGWVGEGADRVALREDGSVRLPLGAEGFAVRRSGGHFDLVVVLPPDTRLSGVAGEGVAGAAVVRAGSPFILAGPAGSHRLTYCEQPASLPAATLGIERCDVCRTPLAPATLASRCGECGTASCQHCSSTGQCTRCGETLPKS